MSTFVATGGAAAVEAMPASTASANKVVNGDLADDGYPVDMDIPIRYVKGMEGDLVEARRRWIATLKVSHLCHYYKAHARGFNVLLLLCAALRFLLFCGALGRALPRLLICTLMQ